MSRYLIGAVAALIVAIFSTVATFVAASAPSRKVRVKVRLEIADFTAAGERRIISAWIPAAIADILYKKVSHGEERVEGDEARLTF